MESIDPLHSNLKIMKKTPVPDNDADDAPEYHAKAMARHSALAAKHNAMADHHRRMHSEAIQPSPRRALMKAAISAAEPNY
jgi:hypothetical protein